MQCSMHRHTTNMLIHIFKLQFRISLGNSLLWFIHWDTKLPAIHRAARMGDIESVKRLLTSDPTMLTFKDDVEQSTLLYMAVISGSIEVVELLIDMGANIYCSTKRGKQENTWIM